MVTYNDALTAHVFHYTGPSARHPYGSPCQRTVGPRGGVTTTIVYARRSGRTQTWKTRPGEFSLPVKHGLYESTRITHENARYWHTHENCPLNEDGYQTVAQRVGAMYS
jgi:hypothetical protein